MEYVGKYLKDTYHTMGEPNNIFEITEYNEYVEPHGFINNKQPCIKLKCVKGNIDPICDDWWIRVSLIGRLYEFTDFKPSCKQMSLFDYIEED